MTTPLDPHMTCSFCGKPQQLVAKIVVGPGVAICDECIDVCTKIINEEQASTTLSAATTTKSDGETEIDQDVPKPKAIHAWLDQYIIGQERAKIIVSVAVYNHYKRLFLSNLVDVETELKKSNILLVGATGTGKNVVCRNLGQTFKCTIYHC